MKNLIFKYSVLFFFIFAIGVPAIFAQNGRSVMSQAEIQSFLTHLKDKSLGINSLEASFTQEKVLSMFQKKMVSQGVFCFKREDKIAFFYKSPYKYRMIINGKKMLMDNGGKEQLIALDNNAIAREMRNLIQASFLGKLQDLGTSYSISYFKEKDGSFYVEVVPIAKSITEIISKISVNFNPSTFLVSKLTLEESAQSTTIYYFSGHCINTINDDEKFSIN